MKTHIETTKQNYIINILISGLLAIYVGLWKPFRFTGEFGWVLIIPTILILHHFFRAGEYILTGKTISISRRLFWGWEEKGKNAKWSFIYYLTTATLLSLGMIYLYN